MGFFCVDNLPVRLLEGFLKLCQEQENLDKIAIVIDVREMSFLGGLGDIIDTLSDSKIDVNLVFLDSKNETLLRRFSITRRKHPLQTPSITTLEAIRLERRMLAEFKERANWIIDTSAMNVHELKRTVQQAYSNMDEHPIRVTVMSFSYGKGLPDEADYTIDCRFLPNPYFVEDLREKTGMDKAVRDYVIQSPEARQMREKVVEYLLMVLPWHAREGRPGITVAFGCTGGRHRSVAMAVMVAEILRDGGMAVNLVHRDLPTRGQE